MDATKRRLRWVQRMIAVTGLDTGAAALSLLVALQLRVGAGRVGEFLSRFPQAIIIVSAIAAAVILLRGMHRRPWRFSSTADLIAVAEAASLTILLFSLSLLAIGKTDWMPRSLLAIQWIVLILIMGGLRFARRLTRDFLCGSALPPAPLQTAAVQRRVALVISDGTSAVRLIRRLQEDPECGLEPIGILDDSGLHERMRVRGVPVLGTTGDLERVVISLEAKGQRPKAVVFAGTQARLRSIAAARLITQAMALNLSIAHLPSITELRVEDGDDRKESDLKLIDLAQLLPRAPVELNGELVASTIAGRRVLVTGAGGTIGRELVRQIARCNPSALLLLDCNELGLYDVDMEMREHQEDLHCVPILCSIRQRKQVMQAFARHKPDLVFHAAALKHVPLVEGHPSAGIQTNVLGTRNVADAALRYGARAMIQVSTDKVVNPVGFMGVSKRLGELYCQALDLDGGQNANAPRFMTVRFGNVLGSSGSLIPLFQHQLSRGGPLTVTHPEIERFFMTVNEAVQLILHSAAHALRDNGRRGRIFVLDMGKSVRIIDVARKMIRLAGLEPDVDVPIKIVGLRPGEKLYEELFDNFESRMPSDIPGIFEAEPAPLDLATLNDAFDRLDVASDDGDDALCYKIAFDLVSAKSTEAVSEDAPPREPVPRLRKPHYVPAWSGGAPSPGLS